MNRFIKIALVLITLTGVLRDAHGQGTMHFIFEGQPPGTATIVQELHDRKMWFRPLGVIVPGSGFVHRGANPATGWPDNGTAYIQAGGESLMFSFTNNTSFDLISVDLAEYSTVVQEAVRVRFIGYRPDGSMVATDLTTDGIIDGTGPLKDFQTFQFGSQWRGLTRVEVPNSTWSLDNLVVSVVPEPSTLSLLALGGAALFLKRRMPHPRRDHEPSAPSVRRT